MTGSLNLRPAASASLAKWLAMMEAIDLSELPSIVHPDAAFHSPSAFSPFRSAEAVVLALSTVVLLLEKFAYHRKAASSDGLSVALEFSAKIGESRIRGVDFITFNDDGKIVDFEVSARPLKGLETLVREMNARLGHVMPKFKSAV
ncbi:nuclear transport factor 2 family protein [Bradyrhizobium sp.]|uniref:nuclear transport factor 2 family protein n=1 Tax=Bradyrhizobium sp. TaxID=376 RepID=UPI002DDCFEA0|nr:nuclear transport factor 2 family protein [Bradyrhizobium sp.]HEV2160561.1 nuclear transport factor 2 family protein [Bradyrhizobium sp.]